MLIGQQVPGDATSSEIICHPDAQKIDVFGARGFEKSFCHKVNIGGVDRDM